MNANRWYAVGILAIGAVVCALLIELVPQPFGQGIAFGTAVMVGRYVERLWPVFEWAYRA